MIMEQEITCKAKYQIHTKIWLKDEFLMTPIKMILSFLGNELSEEF